MKPVRILSVLTALVMVLSAASAGASATAADASAFPTAEEVASAIPRDLVIDHRGLGYLRGIDGSLTPYGHNVAADRRPVEPRAPGGIPGPPGGGGGGGDVVRDSPWTTGGAVQNAAGRILFQLADGWYVCSGTVVTDGVSGRSIILTAAHCVFDDLNKEFAQQAVFIPSQDDGGSDGTDWDCANDVYGCWVLDHGVVDLNWTTRTFPDNIPWDYGYYVVDDDFSHSHNAYPWTPLVSEDLDGTAGSLTLQFGAPSLGDQTHALGYSYNRDPDFRYCAEDMSTNGSANYWLGKCDLSGGSSGGPWLQPVSSGNGPIISVNSWGYTFGSGMAGPKLHDNTACLLFSIAETGTVGSDQVVNPANHSGFVCAVADPPPDPDPGTDEYNTSSQNNGKTWTATVTRADGGTVSGSWVGGVNCNAISCSWSGIPKKQGSVTFQVDGGDALTIYKP